MSNDSNNRRTSVSGVTLVGRVAGALGLVLVASAPFTYFFLGGESFLLLGKLALGAVLCTIYLVTNPDFWRRAIGSRSTGLAAMSAVSVVVAFGVVGVVNYVAYKHPREYDFTKEGLYTLSDQTKGVLSRLKSEVHVYAFYSSNDRDFPAVQETLARYRGASDRLVYEVVDPLARPDLGERFKITDRGPRIVVTAGSQEARAKDASEEELTNAVIKVAEQTSKTLYFLTGHGEHDLDDAEGGEGYKSFADTLKAEGYRVEELSLMKGKDAAKGATVDVEPTKAASGGAAGAAAVQPTPGAADAGKVAVPPGVTVLVVAGPKAPLLPPEVAALEDYLARGGRLLVFLEPDSDGGLAGLAKQWHVELHQDLVVDTNPVNRFLGFGPASPMLEPPEAAVDHPVVKSLVAPVVFMTTRSLGIASGGLTGVEAKSLLDSGGSAWGETNLVGGSASFDDKDFAGPVSVMATATKSVTEGDKRTDEARLVLAGDSQWLDNKYLSVQGNRDLAINIVHWLAEEQARIAIRPRSRGASQLFLTGSQMGQVKFLAQDILPVLVVAFGLGIVLVRRKR